jgi:predicted DNA-binding transcriptional regulator AlpA
MTGLGKSTIYQLIQEKKFPKPLNDLGRNFWRESTLIAWADSRDPNRT